MCKIFRIPLIVFLIVSMTSIIMCWIFMDLEANTFLQSYFTICIQRAHSVAFTMAVLPSHLQTRVQQCILSSRLNLLSLYLKLGPFSLVTTLSLESWHQYFSNNIHTICNHNISTFQAMFLLFRIIASVHFKQYPYYQFIIFSSLFCQSH